MPTLAPLIFNIKVMTCHARIPCAVLQNACSKAIIGLSFNASIALDLLLNTASSSKLTQGMLLPNSFCYDLEGLTHRL